MNPWMAKHFKQFEDFQLKEKNLRSTNLTWEDQVFEEMPILRANYIELQTSYQMYLASAEQQDSKEMNEREETLWAKLFKPLLTI